MALGMIEMFGYTTAILAADAAAKAGDVRIVAIDHNKPVDPNAAPVLVVMVVKMEGGVSEVETAMEAGIRSAKEKDLYITSHIISRQEADTEKLAHLCALGRDKLRQTGSNGK